MIRNILYTFVFILLISSVGSGQTLKQYIRAADEAFDKGDYYSALRYNLKALEFNSENLERLWFAAESARRFNTYTKAEAFYSTIISLDKNDKYKSAKYYLATMQLYQGKYTEAKASYERYLTENKDEDTELTAKAEKGLASLEWISMNDTLTGKGTQVNKLGEEINSIYTDFAPIRIEDKLFYSSNRFVDSTENCCPKNLYGKIISIKNGIPDTTINTLNVSLRHTAHTAANFAKNKVFYTICENKDSNKIRCDIYYRDFNNLNISKAQKLPNHINLSGFTNTQPSLGRDRTSGREILYWVSDRPGGIGGLDIWYAYLLNDTSFSEAQNLKEINTKEDDITPFFHSTTSELYFSSNGRIGYGGFDIYKVILTDKSPPNVLNLGSPINSSYNDMYFSLDDEGKQGLLSSNRKGSFYIDELQEACCNDIYDISMQPPVLKLLVKIVDKKTLAVLPGSKVQLINKTDPLSLPNQYTTSGKGDVLLDISRNTDYEILGENMGYFPTKETVTTYGLDKSQIIEKTIYLDRNVLTLHAFTFDKETQKELVQSKITLSDLTDKTIDSSYNDRANDFHFVIKKGHSFLITAERDGYITESMEFSTEINMEDSIRKDLYLVPKPLPELIPIALYFDNDQPDIKSNKKTTTKSYGETYTTYYNRRDQYKTEWIKDLPSEVQTAYASKYDAFFEDSIKGNYKKFTFFLDQMVSQLQAGYKVELILKGYASPRAETSYNKLLSERRINSIENEVLRFRNGIIKPFLDTKHLSFTHEPFGEEKSKQGISDDLVNQRLSVFSIEASQERRVEIINVILKN